MAENLSTLSSNGLAGTPTGTGQRYVLMSTWESDQQADLVLAGDTAVLDCYKGTTVEGDWQADGSLKDSLNLNGWTTSPEFNITLKAAAGNANLGVAGAGFKMSTANTVNVVSISEDDVVIQNLEFEGTRGGTGAQTALNITGNDLFVENTLVSIIGVTTGNASAVVTNGRITISNCVFTCTDTFSIRPVSLQLDARDVSTIDNVTFNSVGEALRWSTDSSPAGVIFKNCSFVGAVSNTSVPAVSENNAFSDTVNAFGTNAQTGLVTTAGVDFVDYDNGDYRPAPGGKLDGTGTSPPTLVDDISGAARSDPSSIGAYNTAGGGAPVAILSTLSELGDLGTPANGGERYTSIITWESDQQSDLLTNSNPAGAPATSTLECYAFAEDTGASNVSINGWEVDATHFITVKAAAGNEVKGVIGGGYSVQSSANSAMAISEDYTVIQDIELIGTAQRSIYITNTRLFVSLFRLLCRTLPPAAGYCLDHEGPNGLVENCLVISSGDGCRGDNAGTLQTWNSSTIMYTSTAAGGGQYGIRFADGMVLTDCVVFDLAEAGGTTTVFASSPTMTYCALSDAAQTGTGMVLNLPDTAFTDFANADYSASSGGGIGYGSGLDLSNLYTIDIGLEARDAPLGWTIGCWNEGEVGAPPPVITQQPTPAISQVAAPTSASSTSAATGADSNQWYKGNPGVTTDPIAGATGDTIVINPTALDDSGTYFNRYTNVNGFTDTEVWNLSVASNIDVKNYDTVLGLNTEGVGSLWDIVIPAPLGFGLPKIMQIVVQGGTEINTVSPSFVQSLGWTDGTFTAASTGSSEGGVTVSNSLRAGSLNRIISILDPNGVEVHGFSFVKFLESSVDGVDGVRLQVEAALVPLPRLGTFSFIGGDAVSSKVVLTDPLGSGTTQVRGVGFQPDSILLFGGQSTSFPYAIPGAYASYGSMVNETVEGIVQNVAAISIPDNDPDNASFGYIGDTDILVHITDAGVLESTYFVSALDPDGFDLTLNAGTANGYVAIAYCIFFNGGSNFNQNDFSWPTTGNLEFDVGYRPQTTFTNTLPGLTAFNTVQTLPDTAAWAFMGSNRDTNFTMQWASKNNVDISTAFNLAAVGPVQILDVNGTLVIAANYVPTLTGGIYNMLVNPPTPQLGYGVLSGTEANIPVTFIQPQPDYIVTIDTTQQIFTSVSFTGNFKPFTYANVGDVFPSWVTLGAQTGVITASPLAADVGDVATNIIIEATDVVANTAVTNSFTITAGNIYTGSGNPELNAVLGASGTGTFTAQVYTGSGNPQLDAVLGADGVGTFTAGNEPISFTGTFSDIILTNGVPFQLDLDPFFSGGFTPFTYDDAPGTGPLPTGLAYVNNFIQGTPTVSQSFPNIVVRGTDTALNTADTTPPITMLVVEPVAFGGGIFAGAQEIGLNKLFAGAQSIDRVYAGSVQVWPGELYDDLLLSLNPLSYWKMDEASGSLIDTQGNLNLNPVGAFTYDQAPIFGFKESSIAGTGIAGAKFISGGAAGAAYLSQEFTLAFFANWSTTTFDSFFSLTHAGGALDFGDAFSHQVAQSRLSLAFNGVQSYITANNSFFNGTDYYIVITRDASDNLKVYRNNVLVFNQFQGGTINFLGNEPLTIMGSNQTGAQSTSGRQQKTAFFDFALTGAQINNLWNLVPQ